MWKLALAVGVLGGIATAAGAGKAKPKGFRAAKHYAALFALDRTWTYTVTQTTGHHDDATFDHVVDTTSTVTTTCKVVEARRFKKAAISRVVCDPVIALDPSDWVARVWIATSSELAWVRDPDEGPALALDKLPARAERSSVIRARPSTRDGVTDQLEEGNVWTDVTKDHGAWCVTDGFQAMGVGGEETICFDRLGIRNGEMKRDDEGGVVEHTTFTRVD